MKHEIVNLIMETVSMFFGISLLVVILMIWECDGWLNWIYSCLIAGRFGSLAPDKYVCEHLLKPRKYLQNANKFAEMKNN